VSSWKQVVESVCRKLKASTGERGTAALVLITVTSRDRRDMEWARVGGQERNASGRDWLPFKQEQEGHSGSTIRSEWKRPLDQSLSPYSSARMSFELRRPQGRLLTHN
jgi:hypothetical protein